jgi:hypothetical protein
MYLFGIVRAVINIAGTSTWYVFCEYGVPLNVSQKFFFMQFRPWASSENPAVPGGLSRAYGLMGASNVNLNNLDPGPLISAVKSFHDAGVAYASVREEVYNPLLIRPEPIRKVIEPLLNNLGLALPSEYWTRTDLDSRIVDAFWSQVVW